MRNLLGHAIVPIALTLCVCACSANPSDESRNSTGKGPTAAGTSTQSPTQTSVQPKPAAASKPPLTRAEIIRARRSYFVEVVSFDARQQFGTEMPYSDFVRLRISNKSSATLPCLTVLTKRYSKGQMVGSSRAPSRQTSDLAPGESVEYDYYPRGHLDVVRVDRITAEVEGIIDPEVERFFCELQSGGR